VKTLKLFTKKYSWASLIILSFAALVCGLLLLRRSAINANCIVQNEAELPDVAEFHFQLIRTSCDSFGNSISISVLIEEKGVDKKGVIFKYWPDQRNPIPTITGLPGNRLQISIPSVASIYFQSYKWKETAIEYDIGSVLYPAKNSSGI
jgi:hypothetical protein